MNENTDPEFKACPHCAEQIRFQAKVCRFCNRETSTPTTKTEKVTAPRRSKRPWAIGAFLLVVIVVGAPLDWYVTGGPVTYLIESKCASNVEGEPFGFGAASGSVDSEDAKEVCAIAHRQDELTLRGAIRDQKSVIDENVEFDETEEFE